MESVQNIFQRVGRSKAFFAVELFLSTILGLTIVFPVLFVLLGINQVVKLSVQIGLWIFYGDKYTVCHEPITATYSFFPVKKGDRTIIYQGEVEGPVDVQSTVEHYQKHVIDNKVYSRLTYIWKHKWMYLTQEKCDFDLTKHVRYYPGTENRIVSEEEVLKVILPDLSQDMSDDKPQWEEVIVPYYQGCVQENSDIKQVTKSLRLIRIHHSYMDGASMLIMIANAFSITDEKDFPYVIDPCKSLKIPKISMIFYKLTCVALFSSYLVRMAISPPCLRKSRFNISDRSGKGLFARTKPISIDYFKSIKDKSGVSMSAIISTILAGALRNFEIKYPTQTNPKDGKPIIPEAHPMWIVAGMFPYANDKPGNQHGVIESYMDVSNISGIERLSVMNDELGRLAKHPLCTIYYWYSCMLGSAPKFVADMFLYFASFPIVLSNVPLSTRNIKMWGRECTDIVGYVPLIADSGIGIVSVRYGNTFRYSIQVDPSLMNREELDYFVSELENQVEALCLETSSLRRKISTDASLHDRKKTQEENDCNTDKTNGVCNNNNKFEIPSAYNLAPINYQFFSKLKDSIEQIREGIRKIKEE